MKKWLVPLIIIGVLVFLGVNTYNSIIPKRNAAEKQWANVESAYQRRADLIPNIVKTVQGAADFEKSTLEGVIKARAEATKTSINVGDLTPENMAKFQQAQSGLSGALSKLMVVVERYPELKANQNFLELQSQLEGTENRINVERNRFNEVATVYKNYIEKFPTNLFAKVFGFNHLPLFKSDAGSENAPDVDFNFSGDKKE